MKTINFLNAPVGEGEGSQVRNWIKPLDEIYTSLATSGENTHVKRGQEVAARVDHLFALHEDLSEDWSEDLSDRFVSNQKRRK